MKKIICNYSHVDNPLPKGWTRSRLIGHHGAKGYVVDCFEMPEKKSNDEILIVPHDDGIVLQVEDKRHFKEMSPKQMIWLAEELLKRAAYLIE
jgi:hypothetical protein